VTTVIGADLNHVGHHSHNGDATHDQPSEIYQQPQVGDVDTQQQFVVTSNDEQQQTSNGENQQRGASLFAVNQQILDAMDKIKEQQSGGAVFFQQGNSFISNNQRNQQRKNVNNNAFDFHQNNQLPVPQQFYGLPSSDSNQQILQTKPAQRPTQNPAQPQPLPFVFEDPPQYQPPQHDEPSAPNTGIPQIEERPVQNTNNGFSTPDFNRPQIEEQPSQNNNNGFSAPDFNNPQIEEQSNEIASDFNGLNIGVPLIEEQSVQANDEGFSVPSLSTPQIQYQSELNDEILNFDVNDISEEEVQISTKPFPRPQVHTATARKIDSSHCGGGLLADINGDCVEPEITRNVFLYAAPLRQRKARTQIVAPKPKLEYNIVFVRNPDHEKRVKPIVVPAPQRKTLVYVLSKKAEEEDVGLIEAPVHPQLEPEVFFINYEEGQNPDLPGGVDLRTALNNMVLEGTVIDDFPDVRNENIDFGVTADEQVQEVDFTIDGDDNIGIFSDDTNDDRNGYEYNTPN